MADDLTAGETKRWLERLEKRLSDDERAMLPVATYQLAHQALTDRVAEVEKDLGAGLARVEADMKAGFERVERTSRERKDVLDRADAENAKALKAIRDDLANSARGRTGAVANWIAGVGVLVAVLAIVATLLATHGGR